MDLQTPATRDGGCGPFGAELHLQHTIVCRTTIGKTNQLRDTQETVNVHLKEKHRNPTLNLGTYQANSKKQAAPIDCENLDWDTPK